MALCGSCIDGKSAFEVWYRVIFQSKQLPEDATKNDTGVRRGPDDSGASDSLLVRVFGSTLGTASDVLGVVVEKVLEKKRGSSVITNKPTKAPRSRQRRWEHSYSKAQ